MAVCLGVAFETDVYLVMLRSMLSDALVVSDREWSLVGMASHLSIRLEAKVAACCQVGKAAKARSDLQTSQVALERCCNADSTVVFEVGADIRSHDTASQCEHAERLELQ